MDKIKLERKHFCSSYFFFNLVPDLYNYNRINYYLLPMFYVRHAKVFTIIFSANIQTAI